MSNWQYHLEMKDLREKYDKDMDIKALAQGCVERITNLVAKLHLNHMAIIREDMADELENDVMPLFEEIAEEGGEVDEFDYALESLYDWADTAQMTILAARKCVG